MKVEVVASPRQLIMALWYATPLATGFVIMVLELAAFRLYAPYFGYSIYVWGSMISAVMFALAAGYALGGWIADRSQTDLRLYAFILLSGVYQVVILYTVRSFLPSLARYGDSTGPLLATLIIFAPPMTALAMTAPFVIRLLARASHVGAAAGTIYALSTVGSIAGVLATSFYLVPRLGTQATLVTGCVVTTIVGAIGLMRKRPAALLALCAVSALPLAPENTWSQGTVWAGESAYNLIRVVHSGHSLLLMLNDENSIHTIRNETAGWTGHYYDEFALGPLLVGASARRLLVLGMGAGGSITATRASAPAIQIDAVEIDPKVVEAGVRFFGLPRDDERLHIHVADARPWLMQDQGSYELVHIDLYQGGPYVPFYLCTVEFFLLVRAHMPEDGLLMLNVFDVSASGELLNSTAATLRRVFPALAVLSIGHGNYMVFAFPRERSLDWIRTRLRSAEGNYAITQMARQEAAEIDDLLPPAGTPIFTDDYAPVEEMTRRMLAGYWSRFEERFR